MASKPKSRWADDEEDAVYEAQRKQEKEEKKRAKAEKQRKLEEQELQALALQSKPDAATASNEKTEDSTRPIKRRRLSTEQIKDSNPENYETHLMRFPAANWGACRHVDNFEKLNHIEEGSYGWVSRAKEIATGEIVALKKLKMDNSPEGFPVTGLREIQTLMEAQHPNIVKLREVVMGDTMNE
jgi:cell division cycle 2-like